MTTRFSAAASAMAVAALVCAMAPEAAGQASRAKAERAAPPAEIAFASSVGAVAFRHEMHFRDLGVKCVDCHHEIHARKLATPHPAYLKSSSVSCRTCHEASAGLKQTIYACSQCHRPSPAGIADETLSAKVVVHTQCWKCHQVGTAKDAAAACVKCHSGKQSS